MRDTVFQEKCVSCLNSSFACPTVLSSQAVAPLCKFVHAMVKYDHVVKVIKPMQDSLAVAEATLAAAQVRPSARPHHRCRDVMVQSSCLGLKKKIARSGSSTW